MIQSSNMWRGIYFFYLFVGYLLPCTSDKLGSKYVEYVIPEVLHSFLALNLRHLNCIIMFELKDSQFTSVAKHFHSNVFYFIKISGTQYIIDCLMVISIS